MDLIQVYEIADFFLEKVNAFEFFFQISTEWPLLQKLIPKKNHPKMR
jgi:hypothetical protein